MARTKKYKLNSGSRNKITKKEERYKIYKINYNKTNKTTKTNKRNTNKNVKFRLINGIQNEYNSNKHTQKGGFISYFKNLFQMFKFNKLVKQMNQADVKMAKDFENYKNQTKIIKDMADRTAAETTNYIINYRKQSILKILKKDRNVYKKNQDTFDRNIEQSEQKDTSIEKSIVQLDKELNKEMPNFNKLTKIFNINAEKFTAIVTKFSDMSDYRTKINVKQAKHAILVEDKEKLNKKYKSDIKEYEKNKSEFEKFTSFDDTYVENLNKKIQEIDDQIKTAQFYIDQFGSLSKEKSAKTKLLKDWKKIYEDIYEEMNKIIYSVKTIGNNLDKLREIVDSIKFASAPIFQDYEHKRDITSLNDFFKDIDNNKGDNSLKDLLAIIGKDIAQLRLEFIKETPASMISIDYNIGELGTNYISEKLRAYKDVMTTALTARKDGTPTTGGGLYFSRGGGSKSSKKATTFLPNMLQLETYNIYKGTCNLSGYKGKHNPELIFTQETNNTATKGQIKDYKFKNIGIIQNYSEEVGVFYHNLINESDIKFKKHIKNVLAPPTGCVARNAIIVEYKGIQIANLHLEGGRNADKELYNNFDNIYNYKVNLLNLVIAENPDIILGDFNSVYNSDSIINTKFLNDQITYFNGIPAPGTYTDVDKIKQLHEGPYTLLKAAGYSYSEPKNEDTDITTSRGASIIDCIWYKTDKLDKKYSIIENVMKVKIFSGSTCNSSINDPNDIKSDHNPVFASFELKNAPVVAPVAPVAPVVAPVVAPTTSSGTPKPTTPVSIGSTLLKDIIAALNSVDGRYKSNYATVVAKTEEGIKMLDTLLKSDSDGGELKKLSNNIQKITQKLIELKYIEPKLISVKVGSVPTLYGQYSWILETAKDVGKEFPVLSETKVLYDTIKKNAERKILDEGSATLPDDKLQLIALALLNNSINFVSSQEFTLLTKLVNDEEGMKKLVNLIVQYKPVSSDNNKLREACSVFGLLDSFLGISSDKENRIKAYIRQQASRYQSGTNTCIPPNNPFNQSQGKDKNKQGQQGQQYQQQRTY